MSLLQLRIGESMRGYLKDKGDLKREIKRDQGLGRLPGIHTDREGTMVR